MTLWCLIGKEIAFRKQNFLLGVASVCVAVALLTAMVTLLEAHDLRTGQILSARRDQMEAQMNVMEDDYRKIMKELGFNILILPQEQSLADFYANGHVQKEIPEQYVTTLGESGLATIRHLLPSLEQKVQWPEQNQRTIILVGTRGEVPQAHLKEREPMLEPVERGTAVLGFSIAHSLNVQTGDTITLMNRRFTIAACHPERGTKDDITVWLNLAEAQEMLDRKGRINAILALQCNCKGSDLATIRREVGKILPGTQVILLTDRSAVREDARKRAAATALQALGAEKADRDRMRSELERLAGWGVPCAMLAAALWIGLLALSNIRERRGETGILRAIGLRTRHILALFLARAVLLGLIGSVIGYGLGLLLGISFGEGDTALPLQLFHPMHFMAVLVAAPLLSAVASAPLALLAARQDPADILREE